MTSISPWLSVRDATAALRFYVDAFGAAGSDLLEDEQHDVIVARLSIDAADFWIQHDLDASPDGGGGMSVRMILEVEDPDAVFARALRAGATEIAAVSEDHGWRVGRVADPSGHHWEIGRRLAD